MGGYMTYTTEQAEVDYSEYLGVKGKDWKVEYKGASTLVSNHVSWFDTAFAIFYYFPVLTARASIADTPFIGSVFKAMGTIFIARAGKDAKESKALAAKKIQDH
jgi:1-acyl-sn-glycerol-3-phosphate acyltransferase